MPGFTKNFIPQKNFNHRPERFNVLSSGGGTQSNAIICLIHAGILPKPDIIVMSDTERGVDTWLGISIEEAQRRAKFPPGKWQRRYPLIEMMMTKQMAIQCVEDYGLPTPPDSLCWMCPNRDDDLWLFMKNHVPEDFARACAHEKEIQKLWPHLWLTKYGVPLAEAPLKPSGGKNTQMDLIQFCDSGQCFV